MARRLGSSKLHLVATKLNTRTSEVYSRDTTPNMSVAGAVRRFMSIPLFFAAVREPDEVFVDGGLLDNYQVRLFDRAKYVAEQNRPRHTTITKAYAEAKREKIENFFVYGWKLIQTLMRSQDTATWRAATGIAPCTLTRSEWAQPSSTSTTKPSATSRPPVEPAPNSISIGTTQMPRKPAAQTAAGLARLAKGEQTTTCRPSNRPQTRPPAPGQPTRQISCDPDAPDRHHAPSPSRT